MRAPYPGHILEEAAARVRGAGLAMERGFFGAAMSAVDVGALALLEARGFESRMVDTSVGRLHAFVVEGSGKLPPVTVLHGLGSCAADYAGLIDVLRSHVRAVVAPDLFGHGLSPAPQGGMLPSLLADGLEEGVRALSPEPSVFMGNSLGGLEAVRLASRAPELAAGVFLASPGGAPVDATSLGGLLDEFRLANRRAALDFVDRFLGRPSALRPVLAFGVEARMASRSLRELLAHVGPEDMLTVDEVRGLACPAFLFWGADDRILPREQRDFFLRHLPQGTRFVSPARYGHAPHLDDLGGFARHLLRFLGRCAHA